MPLPYYAVTILVWITVWLITRKQAVGAAVGYGFLILSVTVLSRDSVDTRVMELRPLWSYSKAIMNSDLRQQIVANIIMFIPFGYILSLISKRIALFGFIIPIFIEMLQWFFHKGLCEIDDVISNCIGLLLGFGLLTIKERFFRIEKKAHRS